MITTNPSVGCRVRHCKHGTLGTVTKSTGESFEIAWDNGPVVCGYDQRHHGEFELVAVAGQRPSYGQIGEAVGRLVDEKQAAYGNSFGQAGHILRVLYPNGISPNQYDDMLAMVRIIDKMFRIANAKNAFGESPYQDIAGYALLGVANSSGENR